MKLWQFFSTHAEVKVTRVIAIAAFSGLSNAALLTVINAAAHAVDDEGGVPAYMYFLFAIAITLYILTQRYILQVASVEVEKIIAALRISFSEKIRHADLQAIEKLGRALIYASVNTDTLTISQAAAPLMIACQGAILVAFSLGYIYWLSPWAFLLTFAIVGIGIAIHFSNKKALAHDLRASTAKENEFFDVLTDLLEGFKEVKLNARRSTDLYADLTGIALSVSELKQRTGIRYADYYIFTQVLFYLLVGAIVFVLPLLSGVASQEATQLTAAILFIIGPLTMVVGVLPVVGSANNAVASIERLEQALIAAQRSAQAMENGEARSPLTSFRTITLEGVTYSYTDKDGQPLFTLGPIDLTLTAGETVFIVGGNGSGKSTLLKLVTGLYYPGGGRVSVDGVDVRTIGLQNYRQLFSAVFSDYHLFHRVYGVDWTLDRVDPLIEKMELQEKTGWRREGFSNQDLSTGQKKRLAFIVSLLEDRPISVFDEWAADQDPVFRQKFYEQLLLELQQRGKTILAATHDDRYFEGRRVVKLEAGKLVPYKGAGA